MCVDARQPSAQCEQEQHRSLFCSIRLASNNYATRSEEHTSELQSQSNLVCRLLLEKKKTCVCPAHAHRWLIACAPCALAAPPRAACRGTPLAASACARPPLRRYLAAPRRPPADTSS